MTQTLKVNVSASSFQRMPLPVSCVFWEWLVARRDRPDIILGFVYNDDLPSARGEHAHRHYECLIEAQLRQHELTVGYIDVRGYNELEEGPGIFRSRVTAVVWPANLWVRLSVEKQESIRTNFLTVWVVH